MRAIMLPQPEHSMAKMRIKRVPAFMIDVGCRLTTKLRHSRRKATVTGANDFMKNKTHPKLEGQRLLPAAPLLGIIEFAVMTSKYNRSITLDFMNGRPIKLNRRQAAGLCKIIESCLHDKSPGPNESPWVCALPVGAITMSGMPEEPHRLPVYSETKPQNETALPSPRKNLRGCNRLECRVGSYTVSMPNVQSSGTAAERDVEMKI